MPEGIDALTDIEGVLLHRLVHVSGGGEWGAELLGRRGGETAKGTADGGCLGFALVLCFARA